MGATLLRELGEQPPLATACTFEKFAAMIERHWDGIASYYMSENKVSLGCVEGLNNTLRVIQRKAYGFRDEQYLAMKIITHFLPTLPNHARTTFTCPR